MNHSIKTLEIEYRKEEKIYGTSTSHKRTNEARRRMENLDSTIKLLKIIFKLTEN